MFLQVFDRLQKLGVSLSYNTSLLDAEKIAEHFDHELIGVLSLLTNRHRLLKIFYV
jgi:hypothetical protein